MRWRRSCWPVSLWQRLLDYQRRLDISSLKQSENPVILELKVASRPVLQVPPRTGA